LLFVIWNFHQLPPLDFENEDELNPQSQTPFALYMPPVFRYS